MSDSIGSIPPLIITAPYPSDPLTPSGGDRPGTSSYDPTRSGPPSSGGSSRNGPGAASNVPKPPLGVSDPATGRETPDVSIEFLTWDGQHGATGTAQQLLDQLPALFKYNDARAKSVSLISGGTPLLRLPGGYVMQFSNSFGLAAYLSRSAQPVVPTAQAAAAFQSVLGRAPTDQDVSQAESAFNAGKTLADYRASLAASPETANTLATFTREVLGRDPSPAELAADKAQLAAGTSMGDLRSGLAHSGEAAAGVAGLFGSVLGRAASPTDLAGREAQLAGGGSLDGVRQDLAGSLEAHNAVAAAFKAELGRDAPEANILDMQQALAAKGGSMDGVRAYLSTTQEAHDEVAAAFKAELGRDAPEANIVGMQQMLAAQGGSIDGVRGFLAGTVEAASKLGNAVVTVLGRAAQPTETAAMQSMLTLGETLGDVRANIAMSPEAATKISAAYQGACGRPPSQDTVQCAQSLLALGVPSASVQSIVVSAAQSNTGQADPSGNPAEQHGLLYYFFDNLWNTATQEIPNDVAGIVTDFVNDPTGTAQRLGPTLGGFGAMAGEIPAVIQGLYGGFKLLGAATSPPATIEAERQRLANLVHQRELGTDPAVGGRFRASEAATATRLEQKLGRSLSRYTDPGADWIDANRTTYDAVSPGFSQYYDPGSFTNAIAKHLIKQGLDKLVIDMTGSSTAEIESVNTFLSTLNPSQLNRIIKLGF